MRSVCIIILACWALLLASSSLNADGDETASVAKPSEGVEDNARQGALVDAFKANKCFIDPNEADIRILQLFISENEARLRALDYLDSPPPTIQVVGDFNGNYEAYIKEVPVPADIGEMNADARARERQNIEARQAQLKSDLAQKIAVRNTFSKDIYDARLMDEIKDAQKNLAKVYKDRSALLEQLKYFEDQLKELDTIPRDCRSDDHFKKRGELRAIAEQMQKENAKSSAEFIRNQQIIDYNQLILGDRATAPSESLSGNSKSRSSCPDTGLNAVKNAVKVAGLVGAIADPGGALVEESIGALLTKTGFYGPIAGAIGGAVVMALSCSGDVVAGELGAEETAFEGQCKTLGRYMRGAKDDLAKALEDTGNANCYKKKDLTKELEELRQSVKTCVEEIRTKNSNAIVGEESKYIDKLGDEVDELLKKSKNIIYDTCPSSVDPICNNFSPETRPTIQDHVNGTAGQNNSTESSLLERCGFAGRVVEITYQIGSGNYTNADNSITTGVPKFDIWKSEILFQSMESKQIDDFYSFLVYKAKELKAKFPLGTHMINCRNTISELLEPYCPYPEKMELVSCVFRNDCKN